MAFMWWSKSTRVEDLKPDNVVIDSTLCAKLADFGSGRFGASTTGAFSFGHPPGTVGYCAPEVLQRYAHDESADLYSFGVVTWLVFTGGMQNTGPPISQQPEFSSHFYDWAQLHQCVTDNFPPFRGMEGAADPIFQARQAGQFTWSLLQGPRERMKHRGIRAHPLLAPLQLPSFADGPEQVRRPRMIRMSRSQSWYVMVFSHEISFPFISYTPKTHPFHILSGICRYLQYFYYFWWVLRFRFESLRVWENNLPQQKYQNNPEVIQRSWGEKGSSRGNSEL